MALYDDFNLEDFPYHGYFYTYETDLSKPLDEQVSEEVVIFETECDIQKISARHAMTLLGAGYTIYFPLELNPESECSVDKYMPIKVRRGHRFRGIAYGYEVEGIVELVRPSQLGACSVDIKVKTETEL